MTTSEPTTHEKTCICKEPFTLDVHDDNGFCMEETMIIHKGDKYQVTESDFRLIGGEIRLDSDDSWIEISKEKFDRHFDLIEGEEL